MGWGGSLEVFMGELKALPTPDLVAALICTLAALEVDLCKAKQEEQ